MLSIYTFSTMLSGVLSNAQAADLLSGVDTEVIDMTGTGAGGNTKAVNSNLTAGGRGEGDVEAKRTEAQPYA